MALDTLDLGVLVAVVLALIAYFTKGTLWGGDSNGEDSSYKGGSGKSRDVVEVVEQANKKAVVFYGSQTGTAEDYAHKFSKELQARFSISTMCADIADFDLENLDDLFTQVDDFKLVSFFMATYGEGEPTDSSADFMDHLDNETSASFQNVKYTCFGLGNSTYEEYNAIGKKTAEKLNEYGATLIGGLGLGDDGRGSMDEDYLSWKENLFDNLKDVLDLEEKEMTYEPSIEIYEDQSLTVESSNVSLGEPNSKYINPKTEEEIKALTLGPFDHLHPYLCPVVKSKELFNSSSRSCIHAEFDLSDSNLRYSTGDHLAIWPSNSNENVDKLLNILGLSNKKDVVINYKTLDPTFQTSIPFPTTYESVIRHYLEISGPVSRQLLKVVVQFAPDQSSKDLALKLSDDKSLFHESITEKYLNIGDVLELISKGAKWVDLPFNFIVESFPHLQPRYYSISSSSLSEKRTVHVTAVVEAETFENIDHLVTGVTTNLLRDIQLKQNKITDAQPFVHYDLNGPRNKFVNYKLPVHIRRSTFKLPSNPATPIIMIGPGTGVAPFRGFVRERAQQIESGNVKSVGKSLLFFGCRNSNEDFLYKEEWPQYSKTLGESFELITAFSRETSQKVYVQQKLMERSKEVNELFKQGAFFYVCGDASRMARDVQNTLVKIFMNERNLTEEIATDMVKNFKVQNRFQEDVW